MLTMINGERSNRKLGDVVKSLTIYNFESTMPDRREL